MVETPKFRSGEMVHSCACCLKSKHMPKTGYARRYDVPKSQGVTRPDGTHRIVDVVGIMACKKHVLSGRGCEHVVMFAEDPEIEFPNLQ